MANPNPFAILNQSPVLLATLESHHPQALVLYQAFRQVDEADCQRLDPCDGGQADKPGKKTMAHGRGTAIIQTKSRKQAHHRTSGGQ